MTYTHDLREIEYGAQGLYFGGKKKKGVCLFMSAETVSTHRIL